MYSIYTPKNISIIDIKIFTEFFILIFFKSVNRGIGNDDSSHKLNNKPNQVSEIEGSLEFFSSVAFLATYLNYTACTGAGQYVADRIQAYTGNYRDRIQVYKGNYRDRTRPRQVITGIGFRPTQVITGIGSRPTHVITGIGPGLHRSLQE